MDSRKIEQLIEKYWSCETTLEEEALLKEYFNGDNIPEELGESGILFQYFAEEKKKQADHILSDQQILDRVLNSQEVEVRATKDKVEKETHYLPWIGTLTKIAAVLLVGLLVTFYVYREQVKEDTLATLLETDTYEDTQKAYEETMKALNLISKHLNTGREQTMKLAKFNEAEELIEESIAN